MNQETYWLLQEQNDLFAAITDVIHAVRGSGEHMDRFDLEAYNQYFSDRLKNWKPSTNVNHREVDSTIKQLVKATQIEIERYQHKLA